MNKELKVGDVIYYYIGNNIFTVDTIKEIVEVDDEILISPETYPEYTLTEDLLLDETDDRVRGYIANNDGDCLIKLSDARKWLQSHITDYYYDDDWGDVSFDDGKLVYDFCKEMYYNDKRK